MIEVMLNHVVILLRGELLDAPQRSVHSFVSTLQHVRFSVSFALYLYYNTTLTEKHSQKRKRQFETRRTA